MACEARRGCILCWRGWRGQPESKLLLRGFGSLRLRPHPSLLSPGQEQHQFFQTLLASAAAPGRYVAAASAEGPEPLGKPPMAALLLGLLGLLLPGATACATNEDCLLLGQCTQGACRCRQGFTGPECGQLALAPTAPHLGYRNLTASTWGGLPVLVKDQWHLYVSMMGGDCPLGTFNNNSRIAHLVSTSGTWAGPYAYADTAVPAFAHNAAPHLLPDGSIGIWFIGYDGHVDPITCPNGVPPEDYIWPDWSGKQIAMARSRPGETSGPWNVSFLFDSPRLPEDWWHWDCGATNPAPIIAVSSQASLPWRVVLSVYLL